MVAERVLNDWKKFHDVVLLNYNFCSRSEEREREYSMMMNERISKCFFKQISETKFDVISNEFLKVRRM